MRRSRRTILTELMFLQDILKQATDDGLRSATELPYFDGDFWPNALEDSIRELDQEEEERRKTEATQAAQAATNEEHEDEVGLIMFRIIYYAMKAFPFPL